MVAIGGVGGSGTRVVAEILNELGYFIGNDLNESNDNLLFTLLFKRQNILTLTDSEFDIILNIFLKIMSKDDSLTVKELNKINELASNDRTLHNKEWLTLRTKYLENNKKQNLWGWKEPNSHIVMEKLLNKIDNLKFIYVYRNGLDMAYSSNQNQLKLWGSIFFNQYNIEINHKNSLKYWCMVHKKMLNLQSVYKDRILMLDFDELCLNPEEILFNIGTFIGNNKDIIRLKKLIKIPNTIGRYKEYRLDDFAEEDLKFISTIYNI